MAVKLTSEDAEFASLYPGTADALAYSLYLTTSSATLALGIGWYEFYLEASAGVAVCRLDGSAATVPASGASATGLWLTPGVPRTVVLRSAATMAAIMSTGTGTLRVTKLRAAA